MGAHVTSINITALDLILNSL